MPEQLTPDSDIIPAGELPQTTPNEPDLFPPLRPNLSDGSTHVFRSDDRSLEGDDRRQGSQDGHAGEAGPHDASAICDDDQQVPSLGEQATFVSLSAPRGTADEPVPLPPSSATPPASLNKGSASSAPPRWVWVLLISYASAVTLALAYLLIFGLGGRTHQLESLPDVEPEPPGQLTFVPVDAELPPGHVMRLGEQRRFGNVIVEPIRVTSELLEFTHFSSDPARRRPPAGPVLKLWVRFTNASRDQSFAPLDRNLLLRWVVQRGTTQEFTNQYLFTPEMTEIDQTVSVYRLPPSSEWDLADQNLDKVLGPGESVETYIASSEEGLRRLQGNVRWRLQFRKGISPSGNGVTTILDVAFGRSDIAEIPERGSADELAVTLRQRG